jgi:hypothetical protein
MKAPTAPGEREENETYKGLRVADKGFLNTAVIRSEITYIDGDAGGGYIDLYFILYILFSSFQVLRYRCIEQSYFLAAVLTFLSEATQLSNWLCTPII